MALSNCSFLKTTLDARARMGGGGKGEEGKDRSSDTSQEAVKVEQGGYDGGLDQGSSNGDCKKWPDS